jgi:hypothetical protein
MISDLLARIATPFQVFCPTHAEEYPALRSGPSGNSASAAFNSCRHTTSGFDDLSQASRLGSR